MSQAAGKIKPRVMEKLRRPKNKNDAAQVPSWLIRAAFQHAAAPINVEFDAESMTAKAAITAMGTDRER